jgi:uncharacterized membrane-anchored protein
MRWWNKAFGVLVLAVASVASHAQGMSEAQARAVFERIGTEGVSQPGAIELAGQATLNLPEGFIFVKQPLAAQVMVAMGNPGNRDDMQGLIFPQSEDSWFMTVSYEKTG